MANPDELCCVCLRPEIHSRHRCLTCYQYLRRHGHDRPPARVGHQMARASKPKRRSEKIPSGTFADLALTWGEWCKANGFEPSSRCYS